MTGKYFAGGLSQKEAINHLFSNFTWTSNDPNVLQQVKPHLQAQLQATLTSLFIQFSIPCARVNSSSSSNFHRRMPTVAFIYI